METEPRLQLAIRAACEVASDLGLAFDRAVVLQNRSNAIILLNTTQGILWVDWEDTFLGPVEWDLACLVASPYVFNTDLEKAEAALQAYGSVVDPEILQNCIAARTFISVVWSVILQRPELRSEQQARLEHRLAWLKQWEQKA
jgi:thiamine kinase-like enzyme